MKTIKTIGEGIFYAIVGYVFVVILLTIIFSGFNPFVFSLIRALILGSIFLLFVGIIETSVSGENCPELWTGIGLIVLSLIGLLIGALNTNWFTLFF